MVTMMKTIIHDDDDDGGGDITSAKSSVRLTLIIYRIFMKKLKIKLY